MKFINWIKTQDSNEWKYWLGLLLLFVGLSLRVSVATALIVVGITLAVESVLTSYLATWMALLSTRKK